MPLNNHIFGFLDVHLWVYTFCGIYELFCSFFESVCNFSPTRLYRRRMLKLQCAFLLARHLPYLSLLISLLFLHAKLNDMDDTISLGHNPVTTCIVFDGMCPTFDVNETNVTYFEVHWRSRHSKFFSSINMKFPMHWNIGFFVVDE